MKFKQIYSFQNELWLETTPDIKLPSGYFVILIYRLSECLAWIRILMNIDEYWSLEPIVDLRLMSVVLWVWLPAACVFLLTRVASPLLRVAVVRVPVNHLRCPDSWSFFFRGSTGSFCGWEIEVHFGQCAKTPLLSIKRDRGKRFFRCVIMCLRKSASSTSFPRPRLGQTEQPPPPLLLA